MSLNSDSDDEFNVFRPFNLQNRHLLNDDEDIDDDVQIIELSDDEGQPRDHHLQSSSSSSSSDGAPSISGQNDEGGFVRDDDNEDDSNGVIPDSQFRPAVSPQLASPDVFELSPRFSPEELSPTFSPIVDDDNTTEAVSREEEQPDIDNEVDCEAVPGPSKKRKGDDGSAVLDTSDGDDLTTCLICFDGLSNSGAHRVCSIKCGHIFGKECLEKWLKTKKICPQCNSKTSLKDIRVLYTKNIRVVDTSELDAAKKEVEGHKVVINKLTLENTRLNIQIDLKNKELDNLRHQLAVSNSLIGTSLSSMSSESQGSSAAVPSTSTCSASTVKSRLAFKLERVFDIKDGDCRVGAYNEWVNMLVVSQVVKSVLFPNGSFGIRKVNLMDMRATHTVTLHTKPIRDLCFCPNMNDMLLSVSLDKKATLTNCLNNVTVHNFQTDYPLWSCCWNETDPNIFYAGTTNGQILCYDIRSPSQSLETILLPTESNSPIARLQFVPASYQNENFKLSGLIVQKLDSVWFRGSNPGQSNSGGPTCSQLPLEGSFLNACFEPVTRHLLVSTRPSPRFNQKNTCHIVSQLSQYYSDVTESTNVSCNIVETFECASDLSKLCRSVLFNAQDGQQQNQGHVIIGANGGGPKQVSLWDLSSAGHKQTLLVPDVVTDFVPVKVKDKSFLTAIAANSVSLFSCNYD